MKYAEYILAKIYIQIIYFLACFFPVRKNKVVLASPRTDVLSGNLKYIYQACRKDPDIHFKLLLRTYR